MGKQISKRSIPAREITIIGIFAEITSVLAQIAIPLPFTPIPFSLGMVGVYMTGMFLKPSNAVFAQICYLLLGAVGVPVFGNFRGGIAALFGPTGGCLMVYPIMTDIISLTLNSAKSLQAECKQSKKRLYFKISTVLLIAICIEYLGGAIWLTITSTASNTNFFLNLLLYFFLIFFLTLQKLCFVLLPCCFFVLVL